MSPKDWLEAKQELTAVPDIINKVASDSYSIYMLAGMAKCNNLMQLKALHRSETFPEPSCAIPNNILNLILHCSRGWKLEQS